MFQLFFLYKLLDQKHVGYYTRVELYDMLEMMLGANVRYQSICLFIYLSICLFTYFSIFLFFYLPVCLFVYLSICLFVFFSICLFVFTRNMYILSKKRTPKQYITFSVFWFLSNLYFLQMLQIILNFMLIPFTCFTKHHC